MSWSASGTIQKPDDAQPTLEMQHEQTQTGNGEQESKKALEAAKAAAIALVAGGQLGRGSFKVNLSGHANDNNQPQKGWSNEFLKIQIWQL